MLKHILPRGKYSGYLVLGTILHCGIGALQEKCAGGPILWNESPKVSLKPMYGRRLQ